MKLIVAGSRDYSDKATLFMILDNVKKDYPLEKIIHGGSQGPDLIAGEWAAANGIECKVFEADWDKHKRAAGPIRNKQMAAEGTHLLAIWDGSSKGTKNMISEAAKKDLKTKVFIFKTIFDENGQTKSFEIQK